MDRRMPLFDINFTLQVAILEACNKGLFKGISLSREGPNLSLLQYADDALFFGEWSRLNANNLIHILKCFEESLGLKVSISNSRIFGIGVPIADVDQVAGSLGCAFDQIPFILVTPCILLDANLGGLGVGSIGGPKGEKFKSLGKVEWRFLNETNALWRIVIKSFYGDEGGFGSLVYPAGNKGVWYDITKVVSTIEALFPAFEHSFQLKVFNGRAISDLNTLLSVIGNYALDDSRDDYWSWTGVITGMFKVKPLATCVQNSLLCGCELGKHHLWNKLVSQNVNICVWRASLNMLPYELNLSSRGMSLSSFLCPFCNNEIEDIEHFAIGNTEPISCAKTCKVLDVVFQCALWSIWKWQNKVVNAHQEAINGVKKEDSFPFVQRIGFRPVAIRLLPIGVVGCLSLLRFFWSFNEFTWYKNEALYTRIAAYSDQTRPNLTFISTSWRHPWDPTLGITLIRMSAMANATPIVTTVTKNANNEKAPDAASRVNILDFCEEHYKDILPFIMEKARRDKRKEVQTRLNFRENPKKPEEKGRTP
ncbi:RNA-directed DNA polymerase, eukaryota, reverse transcriptase zinc-binding domain protein [Tanacetum coccineum]